MDERANLLDVLEDQLNRHQKFGIADLYKLVHQTTFGGKHLAMDRDQAMQQLLEEWLPEIRIPAGANMLEIIDPRGDVMRVNIRIFKKTGGSPQDLIECFQKSIQAFTPDPNRFETYWQWIMAWCRDAELPFPVDAMDDYYIQQGREGFPAVHHSDAYVEANRPAYRVVLKSLWKGFDQSPGHNK